jgi:hypothetical protein
MTTLAHDVQAKQAERDRLAADAAKWEAKHGKPACHGPEVTSERMSELEAIRAAARRRGGKSGAESTNRKRQAKK